ncbi:MAG: NADH-quinone oxidoreductase subunit N [Tepidisphaeraceae bacterium]|jgi:NADH-quinone oxidoreductase subunit N
MMNHLIDAIAMLPEAGLCAVACVLFLMGVCQSPAVRKMAPVLAVLALAAAGVTQLSWFDGARPLADHRGAVQVFEFARYIKLLSAVVGILLVMLAWPDDPRGTGGPASDWGGEAGEFFALMLLSIAGLFIVAGANDIMLLFLGIELASIPTYIMVSISRPLAVAQEAGVKYFFLGAMAAALLLFGLSYLYGATGTTKLDHMEGMLNPINGLSPWEMLAVVLVIAGLAFKMAVVPLHVYAGDVYEGAATPVTAFLSFVPKASGFVALLKVLYAVTGGTWNASPEIVKLLWVLAFLTMTIGNTLGLVQVRNVKRVLAYSSVAHSGYMLVGVTALVATADYGIKMEALRGVLFYLTAYGLMNIAAFGVLILLPSRHNRAATSAETFEDLAGLGRRHLGLGLAMAVSCFSLIGLPLTIGFFGKLYLIVPALNAKLYWLVVLLVINAAISAAYYLKIVAALFLRPEPGPAEDAPVGPIRQPFPVMVAVGVSMLMVVWLGTIWTSTDRLSERTEHATQIEPLAVPNATASVDRGLVIHP